MDSKALEKVTLKVSGVLLALIVIGLYWSSLSPSA